ncbi:MAG: hypothetical protein A2X49_11735 [Lentisphaerae bacterium GWF2_52_8]|nr:MAG: hypothetical protein A2X49_11735 [Lentisphaerae bacterium GWF2_52_8]
MKTNGLPIYLEMNKGDIVEIHLSSGASKKIMLKDSSRNSIKIEIEGESKILSVQDGREAAKLSYCSELSGIRVGLDITKLMLDGMGMDYNMSHLNLKKDARIFLQEARLPLTPKNKYTYPVPGLKWENLALWLNRVDYGFHLGTDIAAPIGTPIVSVTDGKVVAYREFTPGVDKDDFWGRIICIGGDDGILYYYCHFDSVSPAIAKDVPVKKGQALGTLGNTGFGISFKKIKPHLHFQMVKAWQGNMNLGPISQSRAGLFHAKMTDAFAINSVPYMLHWYRKTKS